LLPFILPALLLLLLLQEIPQGGCHLQAEPESQPVDNALPVLTKQMAKDKAAVVYADGAETPRKYRRILGPHDDLPRWV
jgi:hypothetical protein